MSCRVNIYFPRPETTFQYARDFGISNGSLYKDTGFRQNCKRKDYPPIMNISRWCELDLNGDELLLKALVASKPVVVGFHVTENFMYYKKGVFSDPECSEQIDHALVSENFFDH